MERLAALSWVAYLLITTLTAYAANQGEDFNAPPPDAARQLVERGVKLAERDELDEAATAFKEAIALAPNYLRAHIEYRNVKLNFLGHIDEVKKEYDAFVSKEPNNPVYVMAVYYESDGNHGRASLERVVQLAPEWAWGHYAEALLQQSKEPEKAILELLKCAEKDSSASEAYYRLINLQEKKLKRIDDAIATAEKMAVQPGLRAKGLAELWRLKMEKAQKSEEAKVNLRRELLSLTDSTSDVALLLAIRSAYSNLVGDGEGAKAVEAKIRQVDPTWYPMRGWRFTNVARNESGVPRYLVLANRQVEILSMARKANVALDLKGRIIKLEEVLTRGPNMALQRMIYEMIFRNAVKANDVAATIKYGEILRRIDPSDAVVPAEIALVMANRRVNLKKAISYARTAKNVTAEFRLAERPRNTDEEWFKTSLFPEAKQREVHQGNRATVLDALGWVYYQMGDYAKAERTLRQSVSLKRSDGRLLHLVKALRQLGRADEAKLLNEEANKALAKTVRAKFTSEAVKDFQIESIDGRKYPLSSLRGKVVLLNFWATWCGPCREEMPQLTQLYEKYKGEGLEVIAISTDKEREKVPGFAKEYKARFTVAYDTGLEEYFHANLLPTNVFIDRQGNVRYRKEGFDEESSRELEVVITELLK